MRQWEIHTIAIVFLVIDIVNVKVNLSKLLVYHRCSVIGLYKTILSLSTIVYCLKNIGMTIGTLSGFVLTRENALSSTRHPRRVAKAC